MLLPLTHRYTGIIPICNRHSSHSFAALSAQVRHGLNTPATEFAGKAEQWVPLHDPHSLWHQAWGGTPSSADPEPPLGSHGSKILGTWTPLVTRAGLPGFAAHSVTSSGLLSCTLIPSKLHLDAKPWARLKWKWWLCHKRQQRNE